MILSWQVAHPCDVCPVQSDQQEVGSLPSPRQPRPFPALTEART